MQYVRNILNGEVKEVYKDFWEHNRKEDYVKASYDEWLEYQQQFITFVCIVSTGEDDYFDDDIQGEVHTIKRTNKVIQEDVHISKAKTFVKDFMEQNADNPPYDIYKIKLCYWKHNKELVGLRQFEEIKNGR